MAPPDIGLISPCFFVSDAPAALFVPDPDGYAGSSAGPKLSPLEE